MTVRNIVVLVVLIAVVAIGAALILGLPPGIQWPWSHGAQRQPSAPVAVSQPSISPAAPAPAAGAAVAQEPRPAGDLVAAAGSALVTCPQADPPTVPDGARATPAQMSEARRAFQAYDAATNAYAKCVDEIVDRIAKERSGKAPADDITRLQLFGVQAHNVAIDKEQALADQFNQQLRIYKGRHPGS